MVHINTLVSGLAWAVAAAAIPHDEVERFTEDAPEVMLKYKPFLKVSSGCVPFPAVDKDGNISDGLKNTGAPNGDCDSSEGQVYGRGKDWDDKYAIMYAWYMPKDQPAHSATGSGHRHEWESIVVWLSENSPDAEFLGVAWSGHGGFSTMKAEDISDSELSDGRPLIEYFTNGFTNHELTLTTNKGGEQALIEWERMGDAATQALQDADFKDANMPMKDGNLKANVESAML